MKMLRSKRLALCILHCALSIGFLNLPASVSASAGPEDPQQKENVRARLLERLREKKSQTSGDVQDPQTPQTPQSVQAAQDPQAPQTPAASPAGPDEIVVELSEEDKASLQERVKNKVEEFQNYMTQLANKDLTSEKVKDRCYKNALKLFIGDGEDFTVYDPDLQKNVRKDAARILSRSGGRAKKPYYVRDYLKNLRKSKLYDVVEISDVDIVRVDDLKKVGDHYETMAYFCQKYVGYRGDKIAYADMTYKKVRVIFNPINIDLPDGTTETIWNAYLYDIYVVDTRKI